MDELQKDSTAKSALQKEQNGEAKWGGHLSSVYAPNFTHSGKFGAMEMDSTYPDIAANQPKSEQNSFQFVNDFFIVQDHEKVTRNTQNSVKLPFIKTEYARKSFYFTGAKIYNELPLEIRKITNLTEFKKRLKEHFS